jgi:hypothetical protein
VFVAILCNILLSQGLAQTALDKLLAEGVKESKDDAPQHEPLESYFTPPKTQPPETAFTSKPVPAAETPYSPPLQSPAMQSPNWRSPARRSSTFSSSEPVPAGHKHTTSNSTGPPQSPQSQQSSLPAGQNKPAFCPTTPNDGPHSIILFGLSRQTTHADLTSLIRGGRIIDLYLRDNDNDSNSAKITFAEGAAVFRTYLQQHEVYLHGKRVQARWADKQGYLSRHVVRKMAIEGATRNIVVVGGARALSEDKIRAHLDHIDDLVVVGVRYVGGDVVVSLSSVRTALFARLCLMSRTAYKAFKVEFYADECAAVLPQVQVSARAAVNNGWAGAGWSSSPMKKNWRAGLESRNMYSVLAQDDGKSDEETDGAHHELRITSLVDGRG